MMEAAGTTRNGHPPPSEFDLYRIYVESAEIVSARRAAANTWMLTVNSAIVSFWSFFASETLIALDQTQRIWLLAIPVAGIIVCASWSAMITSYQKLNAAKFSVIHELEASFCIAPFKREEEVYRTIRRRPLSLIEKAIPFSFAALYAALIALLVTSGRIS